MRSARQIRALGRAPWARAALVLTGACLLLLAVRPPSAPGGECEVLQGEERDSCLWRRVEGLDDPRAVAASARAIGDPVLRMGAVMSWAREHRGEVSDPEASLVCGVLPSRDATPCARHLMCAHLR
ncbi:MAG: hypothetical protein FJ102_05435 [Deltaproteobacteria bacterium]|nr:hypothetical protein [Deltaproteobacteria bacterium]